jgi:hypothetical protein
VSNPPPLNADPTEQTLPSPLLDEVNLRLEAATSDIAELRHEMARLDRDLDESRRLNLRAAELLDLVYEHLTGRPGDGGTDGGVNQPPTEQGPSLVPRDEGAGI